jgi:hypothetical protein
MPECNVTLNVCKFARQAQVAHNVMRICGSRLHKLALELSAAEERRGGAQQKMTCLRDVIHRGETK